jgi:hypothetical protein
MSVVPFAIHLFTVIIMHYYMDRQLLSLNKMNIRQDLHLEVNKSTKFGCSFSNSVMEIWVIDDYTSHVDLMPLS